MIILLVGGMFLGIMFSLFRSLFLPTSMRPGFDRGTAAFGRFMGRAFFLFVLALIAAIVYFAMTDPRH